MVQPQRAVTLALKMGADNRQELASALRNFAFDVERGEARNGVSGGVASGYSWQITEHDGPTNEEYHAQVREFLAKGTAA